VHLRVLGGYVFNPRLSALIRGERFSATQRTVTVTQVELESDPELVVTITL
jgi:hypothetical protein